jgi:formylglycine-generating enzyme required for sulfatase activity
MPADVILRCPCGQKMRVPSDRGRKLFCHACGTALAVPASGVAAHPIPTPVQPKPAETSPARNIRRWRVLTAGLAVMAVVIVAVLLLSNRNETPAASTEPRFVKAEPSQPQPPLPDGARGEGRERSGEPAGSGRNYALLVGVREYEHPRLSPLSFTENDAVKLGEVLQQAGYEVVVLTDSLGYKDATFKPTKANIQRHLGSLLARCHRQDAIVVALAGHGIQFDGDSDSFFCPMDAKPFKEEAQTLVSLQGLFDQLDRSNAGTKLLMVDACRNDPTTRGTRSADGGGLRPPRGVAAIFSCKSGEVAREHPTLEQGVFFYHVVQGLKGKAENDQGQVTFNRLVDYVVTEVDRTIPRLYGPGVKQTPTQRSGELEGQLVLVRRVELAKKEIPPRPSLPPERPASPPIKLRPAMAKAPFDANQARQHQQEWADYMGQPVELENGIGMKFRLIPPGEFLMGSPATEWDRNENELQHQVRLTMPYYLGIHEVTQGQYEQVMGTNPSSLNGSLLPVEQVSWEDAQDFLRKLNDRERGTRRIYRLPSEAEWEYACRAGTTTVFHSGDRLDASQANFNGNHPYGGGAKGELRERTMLAGSFQPNAFGLFDMHGNVGEWCQDWSGNDYYRTSPTDNPVNEQQQHIFRTLRGGSWFHRGSDCRAAKRFVSDPGTRSLLTGFRIVCSAAPRTP